MKRLELSDLLDLIEYERQRDAFRDHIIEYKRPRRIGVGDYLTFVFEDRDTMRFQVQEMVRAERIVEEAAIQAELDVYNELIPGDAELSATLMIEIPQSSQIRSELDRLIGVDEHVSLEIGSEKVQASFDPKQFEQDRISAVQYVRFALGPELSRRFTDPTLSVRLRVDHPNYRACTELSPESRASLARDLGQGDEPASGSSARATRLRP